MARAATSRDTSRREKQSSTKNDTLAESKVSRLRRSWHIDYKKENESLLAGYVRDGGTFFQVGGGELTSDLQWGRMG